MQSGSEKVTASALCGRKDETCPLSTGGRTRCVLLVRGGFGAVAREGGGRCAGQRRRPSGGGWGGGGRGGERLCAQRGAGAGPWVSGRAGGADRVTFVVAFALEGVHARRLDAARLPHNLRTKRQSTCRGDKG